MSSVGERVRGGANLTGACACLCEACHYEFISARRMAK